jgi:hypothetical protein
MTDLDPLGDEDLVHSACGKDVILGSAPKGILIVSEHDLFHVVVVTRRRGTFVRFCFDRYRLICHRIGERVV